jgi:hypothetical protein
LSSNNIDRYCLCCSLFNHLCNSAFKCNSPIDQKFFELIIPIATFLTGTLSGIMLAGNDKDLRAKALDAANKPPVVPGPPKIESSSGSFSHTMKVEPSFAPEESAQVVTGFGGKPAPAPAPQPLL